MGDSHIIVVEPEDNVATAVRTVDAGETVTVDVGAEEVTLDVLEDIEFGHKIALQDIEEGGTVHKYGLSIGYASQPIAQGEWVHVHNVESNYGRGDQADEQAVEGVSE